MRVDVVRRPRRQRLAYREDDIADLPVVEQIVVRRLYPARPITHSGETSTISVEVPGMLFVFRSSKYWNCPVLTLPTPGSWIMAACPHPSSACDPFAEVKLAFVPFTVVVQPVEVAVAEGSCRIRTPGPERGPWRGTTGRRRSRRSSACCSDRRRG